MERAGGCTTDFCSVQCGLTVNDVRVDIWLWPAGAGDVSMSAIYDFEIDSDLLVTLPRFPSRQRTHGPKVPLLNTVRDTYPLAPMSSATSPELAVSAQVCFISWAISQSCLLSTKFFSQPQTANSTAHTPRKRTSHRLDLASLRPRMKRATLTKAYTNASTPRTRSSVTLNWRCHKK